MDWYRLLPSYWFQNTPTDYAWDATLNRAMDRHTIIPGYLTAKVGPYTVWAGNWPYAYGKLYTGPIGTGLPSVATRKRLRRSIEFARHRCIADMDRDPSE